jgi:hypothetical protein
MDAQDPLWWPFAKWMAVSLVLKNLGRKNAKFEVA